MKRGLTASVGWKTVRWSCADPGDLASDAGTANWCFEAVEHGRPEEGLMTRWPVTLCVASLLAAPPPLAASAAPDGAAAASAAPTGSVTDRLEDRRYLASGPRAYVVGSEEGRFPASGWHTRGEMGGFWTPPLKMLDGLWFGVGGQWVGPATRFTSGSGYVQMQLPDTGGVSLTRTEFAPDGPRAVLVGLTLRSPGGARTVDVDVDAHSELMQAYPWGWTTPNAADYNLPDTAGFDGRHLVFSEVGTPPVANAERHDWAALVGSTLAPTAHATGSGFRGPQDPPVICPAAGDIADRHLRCDDTGFGKGAGGELRYRVDLPATGDRTVWFAVAGSDQGLAAARTELTAALADPDGELAAKQRTRQALAAQTQLTLPGDPDVAASIDWSKQNLADSVQEARNLQVRDVREGTAYPAPQGTVPHVRFFGAGFPDYPWLFATDGEYTAFPAVALGQFGPIEDHMRALRDVSLVLNGDSGKVAHEVVTDGSVYFGDLAAAGNTDETAKFPMAVATVWRWSGDNAFRDEMYDFTTRNMQYIFRELDADGDRWPEGLGNVERPGMGQEKLDVAIYTIRGLWDLADMARSKGDVATAVWAETRARSMQMRFESAWWLGPTSSGNVPQYADSLRDPGDVKVFQRHWIGVTPMESETVQHGRTVPGIAGREHGSAALGLREQPCYSGAFGLYHTGTGPTTDPAGNQGPSCDPWVSDRPSERSIFTLNTSIMAVGEGNYGRLDRDQQQRYTEANARLQLGPDEQPGAMPEIAPSPDYGRSIDKAFWDRAMVMQAWGAYGAAWSVVHQQLGVRPDIGNQRLEVTPQIPPYESELSGANIRLGSGFVDVRAARSGHTYTTAVRVGLTVRLRLGATVPLGARIDQVLLDGRPVPYEVRQTNRGLEAVADAGRRGSGTATLTVTTS